MAGRLKIGGCTTTGMALMHPSYRAVNLRLHPRTYRGTRGPEAETVLLAEAVRPGGRAWAGSA